MRLIVVLFVSFCLFQTSTAMTAATLKLLIWAAEYTLKHLDTLNFGNQTVSLHNGIATGSLECSKLLIYGLQALDTDDLNNIKTIIEDSEGGLRDVTVSLNISIPNTVGINLLGYNADLAFSDIPLYGKGNLTLSTKNLDAYFHISLLLNGTHIINLKELTLKPALGFVQISVTGFFNNPDPELNFIISAALTAIADLAVAFWDKHVNCCSCALSTLVKAILNGEIDLAAIWSNISADCKAKCTKSNDETIQTLFRTENPFDFWASPAGLVRVEQYLNKFMKY